MRGGFFRGMIIGTVVGTVSGMLIDPEYRQKARNLMNHSGDMFSKVQEGVGVAESWMDRGRQLLHRENQPTDQTEYHSEMDLNYQTGSTKDNEGGKENIDRRVAILEQRLEELSQQ